MKSKKGEGRRGQRREGRGGEVRGRGGGEMEKGREGRGPKSQRPPEFEFMDTPLLRVIERVQSRVYTLSRPIAHCIAKTNSCNLQPVIFAEACYVRYRVTASTTILSHSQSLKTGPSSYLRSHLSLLSSHRSTRSSSLITLNSPGL